MTREQAINAYRRTKDLASRMSSALRAEILVPHFGCSLCRLHNCIVNHEAGFCETPDDPRKHSRQAHLAKEYNYRQRKIWDWSSRLESHFARFF